MDINQVLQSFWQILSSSWFTWAYCLAVFAFGLWEHAAFSKNCKRISSALDHAVEQVSGCRELKEAGNNFCDYDKLSGSLKTNPVLRAAWTGFSRQVYRPEEYGLASANLGCRRISMKDPREFFHEESLWLNQFNERWFASIPNMLTGLGILGTFLGLVAGLSLADFSIDAENLSTNTVAEAFKPLIGGAGQAFFSSIAGLVASFIYSGLFKRGSYEALLKIERLNEAIDEKIRVLSAEEVGLLNHKAQRDELDTVRSISDGWHAGMQELLEAVTGSIQDLQQLLEGFSKEQLAKLQELMGKNAEGVDQLIEAVRTVAADQAGVIRTGQAENTAALALIKEAVASASAAQIEAIREMKTSSVSSFADLSDSFKGFSGDQLRELQRVMEGLLSNLSKALSEEMGKMTGVVQETAVAIGNSAAALDETLDKMTSAATATSDKVNASLQMLDERVGNMAGKLESTSANLNSACENAAAVMDSVGEKMIACAGSTSEILKGAGLELSNSAKAGGESLLTSAKTGGESLEASVSSVSKKLSETAEAAAGLIAEAGTEFGISAAKGGEQFLKACQQGGGMLTTAVNGTAQKFSEAGAVFSKAVGDVGSHFSASVANGTERLSLSLEKQSEVMERITGFHTSLEALEEGITKLTADLNASGNVIKASVAAAGKLEQSFDSIMQSVQANILQANEINTKALKEGLAAVTDQIASVSSAQAKLVAGVDAMQKRIVETAQKTQSSIAIAADRTQQSIAKGSSEFLEFMVKVSEQLSHSSALVSNSFNKNVTELDRGIASAVTSLDSGLTSWQKARERDQKAGEAGFKSQLAAIDSTITMWNKAHNEEIKRMRTAQLDVNTGLEKLQASLKTLSDQINRLAVVRRSL